MTVKILEVQSVIKMKITGKKLPKSLLSKIKLAPLKMRKVPNELNKKNLSLGREQNGMS